ncbi:MAG: hypothetical protein LBF57_02075 [Holosporaceae bacterium]|nr:hypothetical protein [Holosporaceae bacterium]
MNKIVAVLGIIVLITLGGLFFCAGFFTGTTVSPTQASVSTGEVAASSGKSITQKDVDAVLDTKSETISEKIMGILTSATDTATSSASDTINKKKSQSNIAEDSKISIDSLLQEIAASHAINDVCSPDVTLQKINTPDPINPDSLHGKKIVFIGYFKDKIALEIQKLLIEKGYQVHLEQSKTARGESFIFCGPFKKEKNAQKLIKWLLKHDFSEARLIRISNDAMEETLYDAINEDSDLPKNTEKNVIVSHPQLTPPEQSTVPK